MVGMGGAVGPVWLEGGLVAGMGETQKGRGMPNDEGLHLFPIPEYAG